VTTATHAEPMPRVGPPRARGRRRRRWAWLAAGLGVLVAAVLVVRSRPSGPPPVRYETAPVTRGALQAKVTATGTLSALVQVQVGSQVSGRISELLVDYNSPVKKGEVIARIDPRLFEAAVESARANDAAARANVAKAKAQLADARRSAARTRALRERHLVAQADEDTARTTEEVARSQLQASEAVLEQTAAAVHQAEINLEYTTIRSPIDGVVISRSVDVGQTVAASLQSPTLFVIGEDLRRMQVDSSVAEADVGKLAPGLRARFTVDAYPADTFEGAIRQIRNAAQTVQNVVTYDAVIDVENPELKLKPGMTANITVVYAERKDAVRVANAALRFRPPPDWVKEGRVPAEANQGDRRTVWVLRGPTPQPVTIRVGVSDGTNTELVDGDLRPGDGLVTEAIVAKKSGPGSFGRVL
jgi:HlyD family secretion protein